MKKIETRSGFDYGKLFCAYKDRQRRETVGKAEDGAYILHVSRKNEEDEYYVLDEDEYEEYLEKAKKNKTVSVFRYRRLKKEADGETKPSGGKITSFETVTLHTSGMRFVSETEIVMKDGQAEVSEYGIRYQDGQTVRVLERRAVCGEAEALALLNGCRLLSWDGFFGPHPKGVLDGTMFNLTATVNGGRRIYASGSQNFPRRYRDFTDGLRKILNENNIT